MDEEIRKLALEAFQAGKKPDYEKVGALMERIEGIYRASKEKPADLQKLYHKAIDLGIKETPLTEKEVQEIKAIVSPAAKPAEAPRIQKPVVRAPALKKQAPAKEQKKEFVLLIIGSDSRKEIENKGDKTEWGRADAINVVRFQKNGEVKVYTFYRSVGLSLPGGQVESSGGLLEGRGPEGLKKALENYLGLGIDAWVLTDIPRVKQLFKRMYFLGKIARTDIPEPKATQAEMKNTDFTKEGYAPLNALMGRGGPSAGHGRARKGGEFISELVEKGLAYASKHPWIAGWGMRYIMGFMDASIPKEEVWEKIAALAGEKPVVKAYYAPNTKRVGQSPRKWGYKYFNYAEPVPEGMKGHEYLESRKPFYNSKKITVAKAKIPQ